MSKLEYIIIREYAKVVKKLLALGKRKIYPNFVVKLVKNAEFDTNIYFHDGRGVIRINADRFLKLLPATREKEIRELAVSLAQYAYYQSQANNADRQFLYKLIREY